MRSVRTKQALIAALVCGGLAPNTAWAWGRDGHRIAGRVAEAFLTAKARQQVRELLREGESLADASTVADDELRESVPQSAPWHFVNVRVTEPRYKDEFCSRNDGCVVSKIAEFRAILADKKRPAEERREALYFLVHFVQDIHQPVHVGDDNDRGGNRKQVRLGRRTVSLHKLWDTSLIDTVAGGDEVAWERQVRAEITREEVVRWSGASVEDYANESLALAKRAYLVRDGRPQVRNGTVIDRSYTDFAIPAIRERLGQAGVRVAAHLNAVFD